MAARWHLGYFREEFVERRKWLDEASYADLVALCQFLPGPASSQVGLAIGLLRAGYAGALAAWTGFTLPSAIALILFAYGVEAMGGAGRRDEIGIAGSRRDLARHAGPGTEIALRGTARLPLSPEMDALTLFGLAAVTAMLVF